MAIFGSGKKNGKKKLMPKASYRANPEEWTREEVQQWLGHVGFERYADAFRPIQGRRLLALGQADLYQLVDTKLDADLLGDAIQDLRLRATGVPPPPRTPPGDGAESLPSFNAIGGASAAGYASNGNGATASGAPEGGLVPAPSGVAPSQGSLSAINYSAPAPRGVAEIAEALSALAGSHDGASELFLYLNKLGISGGGLLEAAQRVPAVGHIVGALWELRDLAAVACGNRANCATLDAFGADILRAFDFHGKKLAFVDGHALDQIAELLKRGCDIADGCGRPGWLPRMALNEKTFEEFKHVHDTILLILQEQRVATLANGRPLASGDYKDASRPLRRLLKQYGNGSLEGGLRFAAGSAAAQAETIALLSIDKPALRKELDGVASGSSLEELAAGDGGLSAGTFGADADLANEADVRAREARTVFGAYDRNRSGALEIEELQSCLEDLGLMDGKTLAEQDSLLAAQFAAADLNRDGRVDFEEFSAYLPSVSTNKARQQLRAALGVEVEKDLKRTFQEFASFGTRVAANDMDGSKFFKLAKDVRLLSKTFTATDCDIIFAKVKRKGERRISFEQFVTALAAVAEAKQAALAAVVKRVIASGGPASSGTRAEYVKFHDDKSTYTGVYARGGPSAIEAPRGLAPFVDRSAADIRGVKKSSSGDGGAAATPPPRTPPSAQRRFRAIHSAEAVADDVDDEELLSVFRSFATFGAGAAAAASPPGKPIEMDGPRFAKLCRETGVQGGRLNSVAVDIIFSSIKAKGARRVGFREFMAALPLMAEDRGISVEEVRALIASGGGPTRNGVTHAGAVRLHDEHSTYTGGYNSASA